MFPRSSLKTCIICHTRLLNLFSCIYSDMTLEPVYIEMCAKCQIVLELSLMWLWVTCLLEFHMPWYHSYLTFHYPIEALYKEPFGYIEGRGIKEQENYSPLLLEIILESASLCPLEHFVFFSSLPLLVSLLSRDGGLKWWRPRWRTQFLWFVDVPTEVVTIVISVLYQLKYPFLSNNVYLNEYLIHGWF